MLTLRFKKFIKLMQVRFRSLILAQTKVLKHSASCCKMEPIVFAGLFGVKLNLTKNYF